MMDRTVPSVTSEMYPQAMTMNTPTLGAGFMEGIRAVMMPGYQLDELRMEMKHRSMPRRALVTNLSRSTSQASTSTSKRLSGKRFK